MSRIIYGRQRLMPRGYVSQTLLSDISPKRWCRIHGWNFPLFFVVVPVTHIFPAQYFSRMLKCKLIWNSIIPGPGLYRRPSPAHICCPNFVVLVACIDWQAGGVREVEKALLLLQLDSKASVIDLVSYLDLSSVYQHGSCPDGTSGRDHSTEEVHHKDQSSMPVTRGWGAGCRRSARNRPVRWASETNQDKQHQSTTPNGSR